MEEYFSFFFNEDSYRILRRSNPTFHLQNRKIPINPALAPPLRRKAQHRPHQIISLPPYAMPPKHHRHFGPIAGCDLSGRGSHAVAADLDGTLLVSRISFPYFFLLAAEAGSLFRAAALLLISPLVLVVYKFISEAAGIQIMIFVTTAGIPMRSIVLAARTVLPRFYAADVRADSYEVFRACGRRRVVVTANPSVMVEAFVSEYLGADGVLGTELEVDSRGRATGFVAGRGVLVGERKRDALLKEFGDELPDVGLGDRDSDHDFMALCKEAYMVPSDRSAARVPPSKLQTRTVFHGGRLVQRPEPLTALLILLWFPLGVILAVFRVFFNRCFPIRLLRHTYRLTGIRVSIRGNPPPPPSSSSHGGALLVCNHRCPIDPIHVGLALGHSMFGVAYSIPCLSYLLSPIPTVAITRERADDAACIAALLRRGDVIVYPEGTTCREPFLLRFSALFAELSDSIVPVALNIKQSMFFGTTVRGVKVADALFFFMNPRPEIEVTFLPALPKEETCGGGKTPLEVANHVQRIIAAELGFECTAFTMKDKYQILEGYDGKVQ